MSLIKSNGNSFPALLTDFFDSDRFFNRAWPDLRINLDMPAANITENNKEFQIDLAAPGLNKKDFRIEVSNGVLNISAEKKEEKKEDKENYTRQEFSYSSFSRSFQIPDSVKAEDIKSKYDGGILQLSLPKKEVSKTASRKMIAVS